MRPKRHIVPLVVVLVAVASVSAHAGVVSLCKTDSEGGPGAPNLQTALAQGGLVTFQCPAGSTILFTHAHTISRATSIHGGNTVTLDGGRRPMFVARDGVSLRFVDIVIRRGAGLPAGPHNVEGPGGVVIGNSRIEVLRTTVTDSNNAFSLTAGSFRALKSQFVGNRGVTVHAPALEILDGTEFRSNSGTTALDDRPRHHRERRVFEQRH